MTRVRVSSIHPAGKYYIGDICYALDDMVYKDQWGKKLGYENGTHTIKHNDDQGIISVNRTAYGDGAYTDGEREFLVDFGTIGIIPFKLCDQKKIKDGIIFGGHFIQSKSFVEFNSANGIFSIQYDRHCMNIDTS